MVGGEQIKAIESALIARQSGEGLDIEDESGEATEVTQYEEQEISNEVTVALKMTSIVKDLKIKFVNKKTGKLEEPKEEKLEKIEEVIKEVTDDTIRVDVKKEDE